MAEVVGILPSKDQSDILIAKYFEVVDPVYPMIDQGMFRQDYEHVWSMTPPDRKYSRSFRTSFYPFHIVLLAPARIEHRFLEHTHGFPISDDVRRTAEEGQIPMTGTHQIAIALIYILGFLATTMSSVSVTVCQGTGAQFLQ